jgi:S-adenosylmethionine uptake transporter
MRSVFWMVTAALAFSLMGVVVKWAAQWFHTLELVAYRGVVSTVLMVAWARMRAVPLRTPVPSMHLWRSVVGVVSLAAWFYAMSVLPLATASTLNLMSGIWVALFVVAAAMLGENSPQALSRQGPLLAAVALSFGGVMLVLRPTFEANQWVAGLIGTISGLTAALAYLQVGALGRSGEPEERTVFYFSLGCTVLGLAALPYVHLTGGLHPLKPQTGAAMIAIGVLAAIGQFCMTRAYSQGITLLVVNAQYAGVVFSALFGLLVFQDQIPPMGWWGIAVIVASAMIASSLRARAAPHVKLPQE